MPKPDMAAIVASIVTAFENAMTIFKRIQHDSKPNKRAHKKNANVNRNGHGAEEDRLRLSLQTGPKIIINEYQENTRRLGSKYRRGDGMLYPLMCTDSFKIYKSALIYRLVFLSGLLLLLHE